MTRHPVARHHDWATLGLLILAAMWLAFLFAGRGTC